MIRLMEPLDSLSIDPIQRRRRLLADLCRLLGDQDRPSKRTIPLCAADLSRRQQQTLTCLLSGDSEKQIAAKLALSRHTVHVYVKGLYRHFGASSRGELLARWVRTDEMR